MISWCSTLSATQKGLGKDVSLIFFSHLHSSSNSCTQIVGQGHFCRPNKIFGRNYLPFINRGTTLNNRSLLTSMTVCFESCGTGDISSSIMLHLQYYTSRDSWWATPSQQNPTMELREEPDSRILPKVVFFSGTEHHSLYSLSNYADVYFECTSIWEQLGNSKIHVQHKGNIELGRRKLSRPCITTQWFWIWNPAHNSVFSKADRKSVLKQENWKLDQM